jgi:hypothetical protein
MLAILLDALAAYLLRKYFSTKIQFFFAGLVAGILISMASAFLMGMWLNEPPAAVILGALTGAFLHPLLIYIFLYLDLRFISKKLKKAAVIAEEAAKDAEWDANEARVISELLENYRHIDLNSATQNPMLEDNLRRLPIEEVVEKLRKKYFDEESIPSVLRVLRNRQTTNVQN